MFKQLLVPVDGSPLSEEGLTHAADIARAVRATIAIVLVHQPRESALLPVPGINQLQWEDEERYLERTRDEVARGAAVRVTSAHLRGDVASAIVGHARDRGTDLIVLTSHGRTGVRREWLGSVADALVRHAGCPVLMFRATRAGAARIAGRPLFRHIAITLDGSKGSEGAIAPALALAQMMHASISLLRVVPTVPLLTSTTVSDIPYNFPPFIQDLEATEKLAEEVRGEMRSLADHYATAEVPVTSHVIVSDTVPSSIISFCQANAVDCVVMASHGRGATRWLLGSVVDKVLRGSRLPLMIAHQAVVNEGAAPHSAREMANAG